MKYLFIKTVKLPLMIIGKESLDTIL